MSGALTEIPDENLDDSSEEDFLREALDPDVIEDAIADLRPEQRESLLRQISMSYEYSGPIPPSHMIREYEEILPGAADRIFSMAESQAAHRQSIEKTVLGRKSISGILGVVSAAAIALAVVVGGVFLIFNGYSAAGLVSIIVALGSLVGAFIYGTRSERRELNRKRSQQEDDGEEE